MGGFRAQSAGIFQPLRVLGAIPADGQFSLGQPTVDLEAIVVAHSLRDEISFTQRIEFTRVAITVKDIAGGNVDWYTRRPQR